MQKTLTLTAVSILIGGFSGASSAAPTDNESCETKYKEVASVAMKMPYREFDQSASGWRKLDSCYAESAKLIGRYIKKQESEQRTLRWHLAQTLALSGENARAVEEALKSLNPDEAKQHPTFSWNAYVQATVEFLRNDRAAFEVQYEVHRKAAEKYPENKANLDVLTGLSKCFGKPYIEAYSTCRSAP